MSREYVFTEGVESPSGHTVCEGALTLERPEVPVVIGAGSNSFTVGVARDMDRSDSGEVSFELDCWGYNLEDWDKTCYVTDLTVDEHDPMVVLGGIIRAVTLLPRAGFPGLL